MRVVMKEMLKIPDRDVKEPIRKNKFPNIRTTIPQILQIFWLLGKMALLYHRR